MNKFTWLYTYFSNKNITTKSVEDLRFELRLLEGAGNNNAALKCFKCKHGFNNHRTAKCKYCMENEYFNAETNLCDKCPIEAFSYRNGDGYNDGFPCFKRKICTVNDIKISFNLTKIENKKEKESVINFMNFNYYQPSLCDDSNNLLELYRKIHNYIVTNETSSNLDYKDDIDIILELPQYSKYDIEKVYSYITYYKKNNYYKLNKNSCLIERVKIQNCNYEKLNRYSLIDGSISLDTFSNNECVGVLAGVCHYWNGWEISNDNILFSKENSPDLIELVLTKKFTVENFNNEKNEFGKLKIIYIVDNSHYYNIKNNLNEPSSKERLNKNEYLINTEGYESLYNISYSNDSFSTEESYEEFFQLNMNGIRIDRVTNKDLQNCTVITNNEKVKCQIQKTVEIPLRNGNYEVQLIYNRTISNNTENYVSITEFEITKNKINSILNEVGCNDQTIYDSNDLFSCKVNDYLLSNDFNLLYDFNSLTNELKTGCYENNILDAYEFANENINSNTTYNINNRKISDLLFNDFTLSNEICEDGFIGPIKNKNYNSSIFYISIEVPKSSKFSDYNFIESEKTTKFLENDSGHVYMLRNDFSYSFFEDNKKKILNDKSVINLGRKITSIKLLSSLDTESLNGDIYFRYIENKISSDKFKKFGYLISYDNGDIYYNNGIDSNINQIENELKIDMSNYNKSDIFLTYKSYLFLYCSKDKSFNQPNFVGKIRNAYFFEFYSKYACPICLNEEMNPLSTTCINKSKTFYFQETNECIINSNIKKYKINLNNKTRESILFPKDIYDDINLYYYYSTLYSTLPNTLINNENKIQSAFQNLDESNLSFIQDYLNIRREIHYNNDIFNFRNQNVKRINDKNEKIVRVYSSKYNLNVKNLTEIYVLDKINKKDCSRYDEMSLILKIMIIVLPIIYPITIFSSIFYCYKFFKIKSEYSVLSQSDDGLSIENMEMNDVNNFTNSDSIVHNNRINI